MTVDGAEARNGGAARTRVRPVGLDLNLDALPASVPVARRATARWAATEGAEGADLYRICLAVSEAATNGVVHAYSQAVAVAEGDGGAGGVPGQVHIRGVSAPGVLTIFVADEGCGIGRAMASHGLGLGMAVIDESCDSLTIRTQAGGGIELEMLFRLRPQWNDSSISALEVPCAPRSPAPLSAGRRRP
jgi:anti-sigma regulatory factor (Ser/Thr protein kinase)